ncbi:MAG: SMC-Scp complex subunit ScpB [Patescibacteria group bacterium]|nr:SMC-Scp complex subunit ScpB [Patescibacteria group bacterium]
MAPELALKALEAILLVHRGKVKKDILKKFFSDFNLDELIEKANISLQNTGLMIYSSRYYVELVNRPELVRYLINFFGLEKNEFVYDFLEVLAIIAYGGPIKLGEINRLRNKSSYLVIKGLLDEGLVRREKFNYQISDAFLSFLGYRQVTDLPDYKKLRREIRKNLK